jgi:Domain of unknown function (DUF5666)
MQTPTSQHTNGERWARCLGTGSMAAMLAAVAVVIVAPTAGAATNNPIGASGSVAALNASSMEVQNQLSGQTTVTWTGTTRFSKTVTESVSSIAVGDCVTAIGSASKSSKTMLAARNLTVSTPSSTGTCTGGRVTAGAGNGSTGGRFPGGGGGFPGGGNGSRPFFQGGESGRRPSLPGGSGNFRRQFASLDIASGKVTGVNGSKLTVSGITLSPGTTRPTNSKSKKPTTPKTQTLTITTSGSTTVSATQTAASTDLAVGDCVSAFGPAASNGSVTATTVRITSTGGGTCTGAGGFFGGQAGGGGA